MAKRQYKGYVDEDGNFTVVDPDFDFLPMLPGFEINSVPPPAGFIPSFQNSRKFFVSDLSPEDLSRTSTGKLWEIHDGVTNGNNRPSLDSGNATLMDIKIELAAREIRNCRLCGWGCSVNRFKKKGPYCGLKEDAFYSSKFVHVAEEPPATPCIVVKLLGCALKCRHCQAHESFDLNQGRKLDPGLWEELKKINGYERAVAIQFPGGNPDESVLGILKTLKGAPEDFSRPLVWNNNGYANPVLYKLLDGIVDIWLTDVKYGNNECGKRISGIFDYWDIASQGIQQILRQEAKIIVRILILPGHVECCYRNIMEWLGNYSERIWLSIIDNYIPDWKALDDPGLNRKVPAGEIAGVREMVKSYGLKDVWERAGEFWNGK